MRARGPRRLLAAAPLGLALVVACAGDPGVDEGCPPLGQICLADPLILGWRSDAPLGVFADLDGGGRLDAVVAAPELGLMIGWGEDEDEGALVLIAGGANDVRVADLDDDGDPDLVLAARAAPQLRILENLGARRWASTEATIEATPTSLWVGEATAGGPLRIAALTRGPSGLELLDRALVPVQRLEFGRTLVDLQAGDLDGDGAIDLVAADVDDSALQVILGDGQGGLRGAQRIASGPAPASIDLSDLDGDGDLDALLGGSVGSVVFIHDGDGLGGFTGPRTIVVSDDGEAGVGAVGVPSLAGAPGWVIANADEHVLATALLPEQAPPRASLSDFMPAKRIRRDPGGVFAGTHSAYNLLDAAAARTFVEVWSAPALTTYKPTWIVGGDLDHQTGVDVVMVVGDAYFLITATAAGAWATDGEPQPLEVVPLAATLADVNGDGELDLVISDVASALTIGLGDGLGGFELATPTPAPLAADALVPIRGPLDDRSALAIFSEDSLGELGVHILTFDDTGALSSTTAILEDRTIAELAAGDIDGDGRSDLIATIKDDVEVSLAVVLGQEAGAWAEPASRSLTPHAPDPEESGWLAKAHLTVGDLDLDGGDDAILLHRKHVVRLRGLDDLASAEIDVLDPLFPDALTAAVITDVDGDGGVDLVGAGFGAPVLLADIDGDAAAITVLLGNDHSPDGPSAAILDDGGALRIAQQEARGLVFSAIEVAPTLARLEAVSVPESIDFIEVGDVDGDGTDDLVIAGSHALGFVWGPIGAAPIDGRYQGLALTQGLALVDLDDDPALEVITATDHALLIHDVVDRRAVAGPTPVPVGEGKVRGLSRLPRAQGADDLAVLVSDVGVDGGAIAASLVPILGGGAIGPASIPVWSGVTIAKAPSLAVGDFDGDHRGDLAIFLAEEARVVIVWGSDARLGASTVIPLDPAYAVCVADVDGDGQDELVVQFLERVRAIAFDDRTPGPPSTIVDRDASGESMIAGDLDGDGRVDVVRILTYGLEILGGPLDEIAWIQGIGVADKRGIRDVRLADLDGDGIRDLIAVYGGSLAIWRSARP